MSGATHKKLTYSTSWTALEVVTVFGSYVKRAISFTQYNGNPRRLRKAIRRLKKAHGNTNTAAALKDARKFSFTDDNGARHNVVKLAVLITGGASVNSQDTLKAARKLKESGVITIAVGAGSGTNNTELEGIASSPKHVFTVHKFRSLRKLRHKILKRLCRA
ncbi:hypothetical protein Btru_075479 [Bulinus truncatus]|nr:hypothetical protein Btru_075479 [Bulinus truncatus]